MGDQDNSGKVWRRQEDDWGEQWGCVCVCVCVGMRAGTQGQGEGQGGAELGQEQGFPEGPCPQHKGCPTVGTAHYSGQIVHFAHSPYSTPNDHLRPVLSLFAGGDTEPRTRPWPHSLQEAEPTQPRFNPKCSVFFARRPAAHRRNSHSWPGPFQPWSSNNDSASHVRLFTQLFTLITGLLLSPNCRIIDFLFSFHRTNNYGEMTLKT